jgi:4-hydroxy-4-methyl-2-oxoglutarate aldolase
MSATPLRDAELCARLAAHDSATLYEASGQRGAMRPGIHALQLGKRVAGRALTVLSPPGDNLMLHAAIAAARPGEILVAQCHDGAYGVWGEIMTEGAMARGIAALVVEGSVRDIDTIRALGFPVFASGTSLLGTTKAVLGCLRVPISCGGQLVWPDDYIVADDSGIVVLSAATAQATLEAAEARRAKEAATIERLRAGATTMELMALEPVLAGLQAV